MFLSSELLKLAGAFAEELWPCARGELRSVVLKTRQSSSCFHTWCFNLGAREEEALLFRLRVATGVNGQNWSLWQNVEGVSAPHAALLSFEKPPRPLGLPREWTTSEVTIKPTYSARKKPLRRFYRGSPEFLTSRRDGRCCVTDGSRRYVSPRFAAHIKMNYSRQQFLFIFLMHLFRLHLQGIREGVFATSTSLPCFRPRPE